MIKLKTIADFIDYQTDDLTTGSKDFGEGMNMNTSSLWMLMMFLNLFFVLYGEVLRLKKE